MKKLRKVFLVKLPSGQINLIPLDEIKDCKIIIPNDKTIFGIEEKIKRQGPFDFLGSNNNVYEITPKGIESILANGGVCFVEVNDSNELVIIGNGLTSYFCVTIYLDGTPVEKPEEFETVSV